MRRKAIIFAVIALVMCLALVACGKKPPAESDPPAEATYTVTYTAGDGAGSSPITQTVASGTVITIAQNTFTYSGHVFDGWMSQGEKYNSGDSYTVTSDITFTAVWKSDGSDDNNGDGEDPPDPIPPVPTVDANPSFGAARYYYDRIGGGDLELPFELDGAQLFYVRFDNDMLDGGVFHYDDEKGVIAVSSDYILDLDLGSYTVTAITNSQSGNKRCVVEISQSLKTTFDGVTTKSFIYGKDDGVTFEVGYNRTTPVKLMQGDIEVPSEYWDYDPNSFTVCSEWLSKSSKGDYKLYLSNFDRYEFTVTSNIIFATDYDVSTEHDTTMSNTGLNSLYQYYDTVSIADSPSVMNSGKALKIIYDSGTDAADLHNYLTLKTPECTYTWRRVEFATGKTYFITFDYMTHNTDGSGELFFKGTDKSTVKRVDMLYGEANDDTVHRFSSLYTYDEIGLGVRIYARFPNGGELYVDNYKVVELDGVPDLGNGEYDISGNYTVPFDPNGYTYSVAVDGAEIDHAYDAVARNIIIYAAEISKLASGNHELQINTAIGTFKQDFRVLDDRIAEIEQKTTVYSSLTQNEAKIYGSFDQTVEIVSLKQKFKSYDNGYSGGWNFIELNDTTTNFADSATLTPGLDGTGYISLSKSFLDKFWGEVTFIVEFNNGNIAEFTVNSVDVAMFTDYDVSTLYGYLNGNKNSGSPLNSGLWGGSIANIEDRGDGNKALFIRSSSGAADPTAFTTKYTNYLASGQTNWEWYRVIRNEGDSYRITFTYQISGFAQGDVYFQLMFENGENKYGSYFGEGGIVDGDNMLFYLNADGAVHTFDSGWFTHNERFRFSKINFPVFTESDGKFIMLDDYRVVVSSNITNLAAGVTDYDIYDASPFELNVKDEIVDSFTVDGKDVSFTQNGSIFGVSNDVMRQIELGIHDFVLTTDEGIYRGKLNIIDSGTFAEITSVHNEFRSLSQTELKVYGNFTDGIKLASLKQKAKDYRNDYNVNFTELNDTTTNFADRATLTPGLNGMGYITLPKAFLDKFWGEVTFTAEFSNGQSSDFTVDIADVLMFTNYDESTVHGANSALHSGLNNDSAVAIEDRGDGNNALYIRSSENALEPSAFTVRFHQHPWSWYTATNGATGEFYRITFEYQISNLAQDSVYYYIMSPGSEDRNANIFGDHDWDIFIANDNYYKLCYRLIADGAVHTFDSGWFGYSDPRMARMEMPRFALSDNAFIMVDDYRIVRTTGLNYILDGVDGYTKGHDQTVSFTANSGERVTSVRLDDMAVEFVQNKDSDNVLLEPADIKDLACRSYVLTVKTDIGATYKATFVISDDRTSVLTQTSADVVHGQTDPVKLVGTFDLSLNVISVTRRGTDEWDSSRSTPTAMSAEYITVEADGITLSTALTDQAYGTTEYCATFDNGKTVEFTLTSNLVYFTNYDETYILNTEVGNRPTCQDTRVRTVEEGADGNRRLAYRPIDAGESHSVAAINGNGDANGIFTFRSRNKNEYWKQYALGDEGNVILFFDYEIVVSDGDDDPNFIFFWYNDVTSVWTDIRIVDHDTTTKTTEGDSTVYKGKFYLEVSAAEFGATAICCMVSSPDKIDNSVMYIDNYGLGLKA